MQLEVSLLQYTPVWNFLEAQFDLNDLSLMEESVKMGLSGAMS